MFVFVLLPHYACFIVVRSGKGYRHKTLWKGRKKGRGKRSHLFHLGEVIAVGHRSTISVTSPWWDFVPQQSDDVDWFYDQATARIFSRRQDGPYEADAGRVRS